MKQSPLFTRDFTMVVIGQVISLFGNAILRYALPIYLLNQTHSPALFGAVSACAFLPMIFFAPIGGIVADRVNKRNVMVILDFSTAALITGYLVLQGRAALVPLLVTVLMLLYGIQGAYQPAVQASLPALTGLENLNSANAVINMVNSLSGLLGPVLGGVIYAAFGLSAILRVSIVCFLCSAIMEIFIHIPFTKQASAQGVLAMAKADLADGLQFIRTGCPILGKVGLLLASINLVFSSLIIVGLPVVVTETLGFTQETGNRLYGFASGALALGGLLGALLTGFLGSKLQIRKSYRLITSCTMTLLPLLLVVALPVPPMAAYLVIVLCCVVMMVFSTMFSIQIMAHAQRVTPSNLLGKVMSLVGCLVMCAHPLGQAVYGLLFETLAHSLHLIFLGALLLCLGLTAVSKRIILQIEDAPASTPPDPRPLQA